MPESLQDLLSRLREDRSLFQSVEQAVRQGVILPILARLGWDTDNVREVVPEFDVGGRQVDYCLRVKEKNAVFIEVKRLSENLDREEHQAQLLDYAFREGVEIAILTNGLSWWLYLPLLKGSWTQRKFFAIDIRQQNVEAAAKHFGQFLGHDAISNGSAVERARSMHASREKARLIDQTVPRAWNQLCQEPDELLLELLADKVESLCGHRPESEPLAEFVAKFAVGAYQDMNAQQPGPADPPRPMSLRKLRPSGSELRQGVYTFTKPRAFIFKGKRVPVSSFRDVLIGLSGSVSSSFNRFFGSS